MKNKIPDHIKKVIRNAKARKKYFMNKYGNLKRMQQIDEKWQDKFDEMSFEEEMKIYDKK